MTTHDLIARLREQERLMRGAADEVPHNPNRISMRVNPASVLAFCDEAQKVADALETLQRERDEAVRDTTRLDWLLANKHMHAQGGKHGWRVWDCGDGLQTAGEGSTARAAIDDAISTLTKPADQK
ncbi:hypothetical protein [Paraburkholderia sp. 2C]